MLEDTIKFNQDTISTVVDSIKANSSIEVIKDNQSLLTDFFDNPWVVTIIIPLLLLLVGWVIRSLYDKHIAIKPRLYMRLGKPLYGQRILGYDVGYDLTWRFESSLKNNSKYDAYNIQIAEIKKENIEENIVTNRQQLKYVFEKFNHISSNTSKEFELQKTIHVDADVLINSRIEDGVRIILPGIKIPNPHEALMPEILNDIKLVVQYENEKGKKFYIKFTRKDGKEKNKILSRRPFIFKSLDTFTT